MSMLIGDPSFAREKNNRTGSVVVSPLWDKRRKRGKAKSLSVETTETSFA